MKEEIFIKEKFNAAQQEEWTRAALDKLNDIFSDERLGVFGIGKNASTFADLCSGGHELLGWYRDLLKRELDTSKVAFIAKQNAKKIEEGVQELQDYINEFNDLSRRLVGRTRQAVIPDNSQICFDQKQKTIVLNDAGLEALKLAKGVYINKPSQLKVFNLAQETIAALNKLQEALNKSPLNYQKTAIKKRSDAGYAPILIEENGAFTIDGEMIANFFR